MDQNEITSDDKVIAAASYIFSPLVPIIVYFIEGKKDRPFIRAHNAQALIAGLLLWFVLGPISIFTLGCGSLLWLVMLYPAYKAYSGKHVNIPVISDFCRNQGWA
jgi:uncharacterized membrane protein